MKVLLRNPTREIEVTGRRRVHALLAELELNRESHLVIRNGTLVPGDAELRRRRRDRDPSGHLRGS